jgi:hypothetical protein
MFHETIWTGSLKGIREVVRTYLIRLFVLCVCLVTALKLFGWKCWFSLALAYVVSPPFQVPSGPACASSDLSLQTMFDRHVFLRPLLRTVRLPEQTAHSGDSPP